MKTPLPDIRQGRWFVFPGRVNHGRGSVALQGGCSTNWATRAKVKPLH